ncbi:MAG: hypothetical protein GC179_11210 [Anaerolineaceae bacterium]|nr:hypothetical protein [Anaerolineaceae bacterium]
MKIFPDFTWEYIVKRCEGLGNWANIENVNLSSERRNQYLLASQALVDVVSKLREHPQLVKLVPMMSLMSLRWFPVEKCEVDLYYNGTAYVINVLTKNTSEILEVPTIKEGKVVALEDVDKVADEIYTYITKLRDD